MGLYGVLVGTIVPHFVSVMLMLPVMLKNTVGIELAYYYANTYLRPVYGAIPFFVVCYYLAVHYPADSLFIFFKMVAAILPVYMITAWYMSFDRSEREMYASVLSGYVLKKA